MTTVDGRARTWVGQEGEVLWGHCPSCGAAIYLRRLHRHGHVCPECSHPWRAPTSAGGGARSLQELRDTAVSLASSLPTAPARVRVSSGADSVEVEWATARDPVPDGPRGTPRGAVASTVPPDTAPTVTVAAPLVGTFYGAAAPGDPPFVTVGDTVRPGEQIAVVEAMKLMNAVVAEEGGVVTAVRVSDGEMVEFGQVLLELEPTGGGG